MKTVTQVIYGELEINFLKEGKFVGYSFGYEGRNYGSKVEVKYPKDLIGAVGTLTVNAILSYENLKNAKNTNTTTSKGAKRNRRTNRTSTKSK